MNATICFIGAGNMTRSLIGGLIASGYDSKKIHAADPNTDTLNALQQHFNIHTHTDNLQALAEADILVLAVKPQQLKAVCHSLQASVQQRNPLVISIAAGVRCQDIDYWLGGQCALVRTMPNTPALIQTGATALYANARVKDHQKDQAENILRAAGVTLWVGEEAQLDAVTALSGSGPAYYFLFMQAMQQAGEKLGLDPKTSQLLTLQTAFGAAKMALESSEDCASLRQKVTSPNGTTEQAIKSFQADHLEQIVERAMQASFQRAQELADELGEPHTIKGETL